MKLFILLVIILFASQPVFSSQDTLRRSIQWEGIRYTEGADGRIFAMISFRDAQLRPGAGHIPFYSESFPVERGMELLQAQITGEVFDVAPDGFEAIQGAGNISQVIDVMHGTSFDRKIPAGIVTFIPARQNPYNGEYEILREFSLILTYTVSDERNGAGAPDYSDQSVLSQGNWYKIAVQNTGIHRITYSDLQAMGLNPATVNPANIRIYGNGGGMLPESLAEPRHDDLAENNIFVSGSQDGTFDPQDYILFYGESPHQWEYSSFNQAFVHRQNLYSDSTYYFLTTDLGPGKRVPDMPVPAEPPNVSVGKFTDYAYHEKDLFNLVNTGRVWYGEVFDVTTTYDFNFNFPDIDLSSPAYLRAYVAAKSTSASLFRFFHGSSQVMSANVNGLPSSSDTFARAYIGGDWFTPSSSAVGIRVSFEKPTPNSLGWLNYLEVNARRNLVFSGGQMSFRDPSAMAAGAVAEFTLRNAPGGVQVWNVTDPVQAQRVITVQSGSSQVFSAHHDQIQEFIAFDGTAYLPVYLAGKVANQDLHGTGATEMVIVSHPSFMDQALRLAEFHRSHSGLSVLVTDVKQVYNEFSSGAQDITAIRDFMKMLYDRAAPGQEPKYLLLFGDASFDYKDRIANNSNFVPTWEDEESLTIVYSIATDDFFGFLDGPGDNLLDIGIGRLPVKTPEEAAKAVDKIIHYSTNSAAVMKEWRNTICFVADDEDGNMHLNQAEQMAAFLDTNYGAYNMDKIYVDAFPQVSTPGGQRSPEVNKAINNRINKGCLVMNYTGHGGEVGWGHERFLEISDINSWKNYDHMPIFITATCEFSRYDDPERISAGELVYLNPNGGAIAMFTTARATFGGSNFNLNTALFEIMFEQTDNGYHRFGDLIRIAKNKGGVVDNDKKFVLLGDPALRLAYPELEVITTRINGEDIGQLPDTLQALSKITVEGEVVLPGKGMESFNGTLHTIVFDKPSRVTTLNTDPTSQQKTFDLQNNILYKGKAAVTDGRFSFTFIVPKDIAYQYGFGKISYYAENGIDTDAHGFYRNIIVGGFNLSVDPDEEGPVVNLYMNDPYFRSGGITDENPGMLAFVSDASGINTVGSGIGHDIVAVLDNNTDRPIILNDYYEADLDSYTSGTIRYPFFNLSEGRHTLSLKVWDVFNNSGEAYIEFHVMKSERFYIEDLINYPNPFYEGTTFAFSHNQPDGSMEVRLRIFDLNGRVVKVFEKTIFPSGYRSEPVYWDGRDESGGNIAKGLYIYRLDVRDANGQFATGDGKLILLR